MKLICIFIISALLLSLPSFSQEHIDDSVSINNQILNSINSYNQYMGAQADIYNGREYIPYIFKKEGNAFFLSDTLSIGWVSYKGNLYHQIPIKYDAQRNMVVILNYDRRSEIFLQNEVVDSFRFLKHTFINLKVDARQNLNISGFYDLLHNGPIQVLARREKGFKETIANSELIRVFYTRDHFYVHKGEKYFEVKNKRDVFNLFSDKKRDIKNNMRKLKVRFGKNNFEESLLTVVALYEKLTT